MTPSGGILPTFRKNMQPEALLSLAIKSVCSSETSVNSYQTALRQSSSQHFYEDLQSHRMINCKGFEWNRWCHLLEKLRKTMEYLCLCRDLNRESPKYEAEMLQFEPTFSVLPMLACSSKLTARCVDVACLEISVYRDVPANER
jgi:hypothetical protein